jgi:signal transduction protein with GAF and PtsI domain
LTRADEYLDSLPTIALKLSARRDQRYAIDTAVHGLVNDFGAALARLWIAGSPGRSRYRSLQLSPTECLRLKGQGIRKVNLEAEQGREVMAAPWIVRIGQNGESLTTSRLYHGTDTPDAAWMRSNRFRAFSGHPLLDKGRVLGVLALFTRYELTPRMEAQLTVFAGQLSAAVRDAEHRSTGVKPTGAGPRIPAGSSLDDAMRLYIEHVLSECAGRIEGKGGAAELLDIHPNTLRSRMSRLGVER